ncbi:MAG: 2-polyprenyl-3-methyl-5-hydroxy-6-metoxy-1,4-benzoquinol methylase [Polaribacter sp.]|jgi:2-polyprenyl-3-methyl-5-hydroxy-6-metoxy-1,4-benzoquinol methylase
MKDYFKDNERLWDQKTPIHLKAEFYDLPGFLNGKTSLRQPELADLPASLVNGKSMLHLQCHFGQDSLSFARMGAKVTGIDLSGNAIAEAKKLNKQLGLDATFVKSNVYDLPENLEGQFDIVFTSYGTITWLPLTWLNGQKSSTTF